MADKTSKEIGIGSIVDTPGGAKAYCTGDWRSQRPIYDREKCARCGACYLYCPDAAIRICEDGTVEVNEFYCKGCGICAQECWTGAFAMAPLGDTQPAQKTAEKK